MQLQDFTTRVRLFEIAISPTERVQQNMLPKIDGSVIQMIYQGVAQEPPWNELSAFIRTNTQTTSARVFFHWYLREEFAFLESVEETPFISLMRKRYLEQFVHDDPMPYGNLTPGRMHPLEDYVSREDLERSRYFIEFLHPAGLDHLATAHVDEPSGFKIWINLGRPADRGPFRPEEFRFIESLLPYLSQALAIYAQRKKIELERDVYRGLIENLTIGTIIVDREGTIVSSNLGADRLLIASNAVSVIGRQLWFRTIEQRKGFIRRLSDVVSGKLSAAAMAVGDETSVAGGLGLLIRSIGPFRDFGDGSLPSAVIYLSDSSAHRAGSTAFVADLFGLTLTEASLASLLAQGFSLGDAASQLGVGENSARTSLKRIFAKTGLHRQTELVTLILHSVAVMTSSK